MAKEETEKYRGGLSALTNIFRTEWSNLGTNRGVFLFYAGFFIVAAIIELLNPLVIGLVFNAAQNEITSQPELMKLIKLISLLLVLELGFLLFYITGRYLERRTGYLVGRTYTNKKIFQVLELPIKWHKDHHSGDTIDKINRSSSAIDTFSQHYTFQIIFALINLIGAVVILMFFDAFAAISALVFSIFVTYIIILMDKRLTKKYKKINRLGNKASAAIFDYLSNVITVITLRLKKTVRREIDSRVMASYKTHKESAFLDEIKWGFAGLALNIMTVVLLSYRAYTDYTTNGVIMIGTLYIFYGYLSAMGNTFFRIAGTYSDIVRFDANLNNAKKIDDEYEGFKAKAGGRLPPGWGDVEIKNLDFAYSKEGKKNHLSKVEFKFKRGEKIALVGESGSGKSTFLSLLRGLYEPERAEVHCDGKLLKGGMLNFSDNVTLIPQEPEIFNNTIKYNVTMDLSYTDEEVKKAIEMARFTKVVERLSKGLKTSVLEKGVSLSGGEKQRLALARGILAAKDSEIILLDEPTSSVDSLNEMEIHNNIFREFHNKTIISSIHRLHLLEKFDHVYFFDKGRIIAHGTLEEVRKNSKFRYLWNKYHRKK